MRKKPSTPRRKRVPLHLASLLRVREVKEFDRVSGLDRWTIARQFRAAFGTSPTRFRTMRQLDQARLLINGGMPLRDAALEAGFADQSHMSRMFKRTYGLTPARWAQALG
jgi:AraC-like DNA-binding protein